jgi:hypothetical protein
MPSYEIREIHCGYEETCAWLSIWYGANPKRRQVLHLVVSAPGYWHGMSPAYMERHDQAVACYGGAERILVSKGASKSI